MLYKDLLLENVRLKRENSSLRKSDAEGRGVIGRKMTDNAERGRGYMARSYMSFIRKSFLSSPLYYMYDKVICTVRPLMWVMRAFRILLIAAAAVQVSAVLVVMSAVALALLPVIIIVSLANVLYVRRTMRAMSHYIKGSLEERRAVAFFSPAFTSTFFDTAFALNARGYTVLCVCDYKTPKAFRPKLLTGIREPYKNVFMVREHYWFYMKKLINESGVYSVAVM